MATVTWLLETVVAMVLAVGALCLLVCAAELLSQALRGKRR